MDRYAIERLLGSGSMGSVYLAHDSRLHRKVALKILGSGAEHLGAPAIALAMREARAAGAVSHPNAAAVFDADAMNGAAYIVMEYVPGNPLRRSIGDPSVSQPLKVRWLVEVASALAAAHAVGVVHRDVKPENVMIRSDGMAKVLDFGVARMTEHRDGSTGTFDAVTWTQAGGVVGTPGYMAPEILLGNQADARADQFGWAVLAYELLSGRLPWSRANNAIGVMASALTDEPQPLGPSIPPGMASTILRALAKSPGDRFASLSDVVALLLDFADVGPWRVPYGAAAVLPPPSVRLARPIEPRPDDSPPRIRDSRPDEGPSPSRRRVDSRPDESPASSGPGRRWTESRPDESYPPPGLARRRPDSRPEEAPPSSPAGRRSPIFRPPDFAAPVSVDAQIALLPAAATCKGMFFGDLIALASKCRSPEEIASLAGIPERRYVSFRDYPMADMMRLTTAVAQVVYPSVPLGEALRRLGRRALSLVLDCHAGRTLLGVLPRELGAYLLHGPKACRLLMGGLGEVTTERFAPTLFHVHARGMPIFLETYQVGVLESVLSHCSTRGDVEIALHGLADATASVRVW